MKNSDKTKMPLEKKAEVSEPIEKKPQQSVDKRKEFEKLINEQFKEQFEEILKEKVDKHIEENNLLKTKLSQTSEVLDMLSDRYSAGSVKELKEALKADNSLFADKADKYGMDVESYRYMRNLERENARNKAQLEKSAMEKDMAEKMKLWYAQSGAVAGEYPDFNLAQEIENPGFVNLIKNGVDMKTAYEVLHHNDILNRIRKENADEAKKEAVMELEARNNRPVENGLSSQSSAVIKKNVAMLTPEERAEIAKRAARGEIISF